MKNGSNSLSIVILAAGKTKTKICPSLVSLPDNKTLIEYQIRTLKERFPKAEIIVVVGFLADSIIPLIENGVKVVENENYSVTGGGRSLELALRICTKQNLLIIHGDILFTPQCFNNPDKGSYLVVDRKKELASDTVSVNHTFSPNKVNCLAYGLEDKWGQIAYLTNREYTLLKQLIKNGGMFRRSVTHEVLNTLLLNPSALLKIYTNDDIHLMEINRPIHVWKNPKLWWFKQ